MHKVYLPPFCAHLFRLQPCIGFILPYYVSLVHPSAREYVWRYYLTTRFTKSVVFE